jgi:branched-chain amino acid transport system ATP-binding protein
MNNPVLEAVGLVKRFDGVIATNGVRLDVQQGEIHAIIGPNGAGKSTLISLLSGELASDEGSVMLSGEDITSLSVNRRAARGIARSYQTTSIFSELSVLNNVALGIQSRSGRSFRFWKNVDAEKPLRDAALKVLDEVGMIGRAEVKARHLAHGEKRQVEIAMALAMDPKVLLLDEPFAGMGQSEAKTVITLIAALKARVPILLVEHDMDAVFALADRISVLVYGKVIATGSPKSISANPEVRAAYLTDE